MRFSAISFACWRFALAIWLTGGYFNTFLNNSQKKNGENALFLDYFFNIEIRNISTMVYLKYEEFFALEGIEGLYIDALDKLGYAFHDDTGKLCYLEDPTYRV